MGGLVDPTHSPAKMILSAFIHTSCGILNTTKYTGHKLVLHDLNAGTPPVHKVKSIFGK